MGSKKSHGTGQGGQRTHKQKQQSGWPPKVIDPEEFAKLATVTDSFMPTALET